MPLPDTHTPHRMIRIGHKRWDAFGLLTGARLRTKAVNEFIAWYVREPGAKLPERPAVDAAADARTQAELMDATRQRAAV